MRAYLGNFILKSLRCLLAAVLLAMAGAMTPASATSFGTDHSDLWWNQSEPGWGIQLVQRDAVIFATLFAYDASNAPVWYSATLSYQGNLVWSGDLIVTSGPWFGESPFAASTVTRRTVGTMKWVPSDVDNGTLTYTIDGVQVAKTMTRQVLAVEIYSGRYLGAMHQDVTGCSNPGSNGSFEQTGVLTITQTRSTLGMTSNYQTGAACSYQGAFFQSGQLGNAFGNYSCTNGDTGSVVLFEMQVMRAGLTGRIHATSTTSGCSSTGWFGGMYSFTSTAN